MENLSTGLQSNNLSELWNNHETAVMLYLANGAKLALWYNSFGYIENVLLRK